MSRPKISLQEWLGKEQALKKKFLIQELNPSNFYGLLQNRKTPNGTIHIEGRFGNNQQTENAILENTPIKISEVCFDKLKGKFRIFKNKEKKLNLIKKQYNFSKETAYLIKKIKTELNLLREEEVIENLINSHTNNATLHQNKIKIQTKEIKLDILKLEIEENNQRIFDLTLENKILKDKIKDIMYMLAASHLKNEYLKDNLQNYDLSYEFPTPSEDKILKKVFELNDLLKESL
jgi:hypothetical protein